MGVMIAESYRGMGVIFELVADRLLVPVAVIVALLGAAVIGIQLFELLHIAPLGFERI